MRKLIVSLALVSILLVAVVPAFAKDVGGLNIDGYCKKLIGSYAYAALVSQDARGWRCAVNWFFWPVYTNIQTMDSVCIWQYGRGSWASTSNWSSPYSWRCNR